jgi:hypothetical protein
MSFSNEDKNVWTGSEVMREFEKIAEDLELLNGPPAEAFSPIGDSSDEEDDPSWEEEIIEDPEKAIGDAAMELTGEEDDSIAEGLKADDGNLKTEMASLYMNNLLSNLQDLAHDLAEQGHIKVARKIEVTINIIKGGSK